MAPETDAPARGPKRKAAEVASRATRAAKVKAPEPVVARASKRPKLSVKDSKVKAKPKKSPAKIASEFEEDVEEDTAPATPPPPTTAPAAAAAPATVGHTSSVTPKVMNGLS